jgi:hypothetical protein
MAGGGDAAGGGAGEDARAGQEGRAQHPVISGKQLADADGVLFGFPLRRRRALQVEPRY